MSGTKTEATPLRRALYVDLVFYNCILKCYVLIPWLDSEAIDFRAASEFFAAVRRLGRRDPLPRDLRTEQVEPVTLDETDRAIVTLAAGEHEQGGRKRAAYGESLDDLSRRRRRE